LNNQVKSVSIRQLARFALGLGIFDGESVSGATVYLVSRKRRTVKNSVKLPDANEYDWTVSPRTRKRHESLYLPGFLVCFGLL
jgi:hypothetical protein